MAVGAEGFDTPPSEGGEKVETTVTEKPPSRYGLDVDFIDIDSALRQPNS
jgi:hypothetical protein